MYLQNRNRLMDVREQTLGCQGGGMVLEVGVSRYSSVQLLSCVQLFPFLQTISHQAPWSLGFPRQEYQNELPLPSHPGIEPASPVSPALQAESLPTEPSGKPCGTYIQ